MTIQFTKDWTGKDARGREYNFREGAIIKAHHYPTLNLPQIIIAGKAKDVSPDREEKPKPNDGSAKAAPKPTSKASGKSSK